METDGGRPLTPREAQAALDAARDAEDTIRYPPLPAWFFPAMAALVAGIDLAQLLDSPLLPMVTCALVAGYLGRRFWLRRDGVSWVSMKVTDMLPFLAVIVGTLVVAMIVEDVTGARWVWIVVAAVHAGIVLFTGRRYHREYPRAE